MANITWSAKSGSDWTNNELVMYNIIIKSIPPSKFFPTPDLLLDLINPAILNPPAGATDPAISNVTTEFLGYLNLTARATQENFIDDFTAETLELLGFNKYGTTVSTHYIIPLTICGEANHTAQTGVCVIHHPTFILLVLIKDKVPNNRSDAEAQVIAEAIATFQFNNRKHKEHGLDPLGTMTDTFPTFFLVPVTLELSNAAITGQYPKIPTQVLCCATALTHLWGTSTGMEDTKYRKLALKRFPAFKTLAKNHWVHIFR